jgi:hypothetical protein
MIFNKVLLGKWLWRYAHERDARWKSVVDAKYGSSSGGWCSLDPHWVSWSGALEEH